MTILITSNCLRFCWEEGKKLFQGRWRGDFDCMCFTFSPMPNFKASFVSSDGESPPIPLNLAFTQVMSIFCKSVENVKVTGVERANMLEDA